MQQEQQQSAYYDTRQPPSPSQHQAMHPSQHDNQHLGVNNQYSYPPSNNASSSSTSSLGSYSNNEKMMERTHSNASSAAVPILSEKSPTKGGYAHHPSASITNNHAQRGDVHFNDDVNDDSELPAAIPRYPNGNGNRPGSQFKQGHISRGSVALLAAAEGKIPKKEGLKMWRSDEHHGTFTRGGAVRTCVRCTICTIIFAFILILGVLAAFLLWVRPPNVTFQGVTSPSVNIVNSGFNLNLTLDIAVSNPNFFGASFKQISAKAYYPTNTTSAIGGGVLDNVHIQPHSHNSLFFPFAIQYSKAIDPNSIILQDIATKCGFIGNTPSNIKVNYDLTVAIKIVVFTISPTFSSSTSFPCPLTQSQVQGLLGGGSGSILGG